MPSPPVRAVEHVPRLRDALGSAGFTFAGVTGLLGEAAHGALMRNETTPALRATAGGSPLETLTRLWLLQTPVPLADAERALPGLVEELCATGILRRATDEVVALVDLRPYAADDSDLRPRSDSVGAFWIASDLTPGLDGAPVRLEDDHVLGISSASTSLAQLTVRRPAGRALDLGCGCGVQALHLAGHCAEVIATDVNPRALWLTGLNAALNEVDLQVREGSFWEPVAGEGFDLIVTNPPFVISPPGAPRLVYRDSGLPGDRVVEDIVRGAAAHLRPGGLCQVLANWLVLREQPWDQRLVEWLDPALDGWVVQRELVDPPTYVELWLKDAGRHPSTGADPREYRRRYDAWLAWLEDLGAEGIGFGWINLQRRATASGTAGRRFDDWPWEVEQPFGDEVAAHFARVDALRGLDDTGLWASRLVVRPDVRQETVGSPGAADPEVVLLRQQRGLRRARRVSTAEAAFVGACDGELAAGQLADAVDQLVGSRVAVEFVRELIGEGFLALG